MSEATDALAECMADSISQHGVTVAVDGGGSFLSVVEQFQRGNMPTDFGNREVAGVTLLFPRASWTPVVGKRVTIDSKALVVASVDYTNPASFVVTCTEGNL